MGYLSTVYFSIQPGLLSPKNLTKLGVNLYGRTKTQTFTTQLSTIRTSDNLYAPLTANPVGSDYDFRLKHLCGEYILRINTD